MDPQHVHRPMKSETPYSLPSEDILYNANASAAAAAAAAAAGMIGLPGMGSLMHASQASTSPGGQAGEALIKTEPSDDNDDLTDDGGGIHGVGGDPYSEDPGSVGKNVSAYLP